MWRGFTFTHPAPRRPASYGACKDFTTTPSWPCAIASAKNRAAVAGSSVTIRGTRSRSGTTASSTRCRSAAEASRRSRPSWCRTSKTKSASGTEDRRVVTSRRLLVRAAVSWNGRGRPASSSAIASPSRTTEWTASDRTASTSSGTRAVMSSRVRVNTHTSSPARCSWTRMPSSFHSNAAGPTGEVCARALATSGADWASIGRIGRPTSSATARRLSTPSRSAAAAIGGNAPRSMNARRTSASGTSAAAAIASTMTPSCAPCRNSPPASAIRNARSGSVAAANSSPSSAARRACEPGPESAAMRAKALSTNDNVREGSDGGVFGSGSSLASRSAAQPTPVRRWRNSPERKAAAISTSSPTWSPSGSPA